MEIEKSLEKISQAIKTLQLNVKKSERKETNDISEYFISEHQKDLLLNDIHYEIKQELKVLFGKVVEGDKYGLFNDVFHSTASGYDSGVMFSYWSFHGVPYNSSKTENGKWRDNFFYKGSRYSVKEYMENFYSPFNVISSLCNSRNQESNAPIDFFVRHAKSSKNAIRKIVFLPKIKSIVVDDAIYFPVKDDFVDEIYFTNELKALIEGLYLLKDAKDKCAGEPKRLTVTNDVRTLLHVNLEKAFEIIKNSDNSIIHQFCNNLQSKFPHLDSKNEEILQDVFYLIICYQFYDHDGITHLYLPENISESLCCLGLLIPFGNNCILSNYDNQFKMIISTLSELPILEKKIFDHVKDNIISKNIWKAHYLSRAPIYDSLCQHFCVLLKYICREKNVKVLDITYRVKEFDSFYNRVVNRFNKPGDFKIPINEFTTYRSHFLSGGSKDSIDYIFSKFWDIAGIRVLCVFQNDIKIIYDELCGTQLYESLKELNNPYINNVYNVKVNFFDKKTNNDYRAEHYVLKLGDERLKFPELKELKDLLCELQVKTTLSQGWSDADHDIFYKSKLPTIMLEELLPESNERIGNERGMTSRKLEEIDKKFNEFRNTIKEIIDEI